MFKKVIFLKMSLVKESVALDDSLMKVEMRRDLHERDSVCEAQAEVLLRESGFATSEELEMLDKIYAGLNIERRFFGSVEYKEGLSHYEKKVHA